MRRACSRGSRLTWVIFEPGRFILTVCCLHTYWPSPSVVARRWDKLFLWDMTRAKFRRCCGSVNLLYTSYHGYIYMLLSYASARAGTDTISARSPSVYPISVKTSLRPPILARGDAVNRRCTINYAAARAPRQTAAVPRDVMLFVAATVMIHNIVHFPSLARVRGVELA